MVRLDAGRDEHFGQPVTTNLMQIESAVAKGLTSSTVAHGEIGDPLDREEGEGEDDAVLIRTGRGPTPGGKEALARPGTLLAGAPRLPGLPSERFRIDLADPMEGKTLMDCAEDLPGTTGKIGEDPFQRASLVLEQTLKWIEIGVRRARGQRVKNPGPPVVQIGSAAQSMPDPLKQAGRIAKAAHRGALKLAGRLSLARPVTTIQGEAGFRRETNAQTPARARSMG